MRITAQEAKEISLEVWRYFAEHPEIHSKESLPGKLFREIKQFELYCPLCELFLKENCFGCPLFYCLIGNGLYGKWFHSRLYKKRIYYSQEIVKTIEAWDPDKA